MCANSQALPGKWDLAPPRLVKQAMKYKAQGPAGRYNCRLDPSDTHKVWAYSRSHSFCPHRIFPTRNPSWRGWGWLSSTLARNAGHSHTSLKQQLPTCHSYFVTCWTTHSKKQGFQAELLLALALKQNSSNPIPGVPQTKAQNSLEPGESRVCGC